MGRLRSMKPRLATLAPMVRALPKAAEPFYRSPEWKATRKAKLAEGPAFCCICGATGRLILDHDEERKDGGADIPPLHRLKWYCGPHHNAKTAKARRARVAGHAG